MLSFTVPRTNLTEDRCRSMDFREVAGRTNVHLIGVSAPRSGHNLVVRLLQALFADDLFYCERYLVSGCCQAVPCVRQATARISFQKSHDLELDLPRDVADAFYLVQHRAPVPAILSAREMYADEYGEAIAGDRDAYAVWLGRSAEYLVAFHERWIAQPPANGIVLDYDELVASPADAVRRILREIGIEADDARIVAAAASIAPHGGLTGERPFVPRSIEASQYMDRELLTAFESVVVDALPAYAPARAFDPVDPRGTLIWSVFQALRASRLGNLDEGIRLLQEAVERWPDNGMLHYELAWLLIRQSRLAEARPLLQRAARVLPKDPPVLDLLVTAALAAGDAPSAVAHMRSLVAQVEPTPAVELRLAKVLAHNSDRAGAAEILARVTGAEPDDPQLWRDVSEVRLIRGELSEARLALETAIRLAPLQADLYAQHGSVLLMLEKPGQAAVSLRQSLALDVRQPATWALLIEALGRDGDRAAIMQAADEARAALPDDHVVRETLARVVSRAQAPSRSSSAGHLLRSLFSCPPSRPGHAVAQAVRRLRRLDRVPAQVAHRVRQRLRPPAQADVHLAQLRSALGAAERRLAETEHRLHQQLEGAWEQAARLDTALNDQRQATVAATRRVAELEAAMATQARTAMASAEEKDRELQELRLSVWRLQLVSHAAGTSEQRRRTGEQDALLLDGSDTVQRLP
jgi:predicted Zn-dependent protease